MPLVSAVWTRPDEVFALMIVGIICPYRKTAAETISKSLNEAPAPEKVKIRKAVVVLAVPGSPVAMVWVETPAPLLETVLR